MRMKLQTLGIAAMGVAVVGLFAVPHNLSELRAQSKGKSSKKPTNVKTLDVRAQRLQTEFLRDSSSLARDYENAGELEKARRVYAALAKMNPESKEISDRIKKLDEAILTSKAFEVEVDTSTGWGVPLARVTKGKVVQIQASGSYRLQASLAVGTDGFVVGDPTKGEMAGNIRCGALMGMVVANGKPGKPFAVGSSAKFTPRDSGLLYLRVNVPSGSKSMGRLAVQLGGYVEQN